MLTVFVTIFQMATQAMSVQKGMAANDQKVRLVQSLLRNDLNGDMYDKTDPTKPQDLSDFSQSRSVRGRRKWRAEFQ